MYIKSWKGDTGDIFDDRDPNRYFRKDGNIETFMRGGNEREAGERRKKYIFFTIYYW